jgi:dihydroxyacetone kinase
MKQVLAAIAAVPSDKGTILLITNYTVCVSVTG